MTGETVCAALTDISAESDANLKNLKLASLVSAVFRDAGVELVMVGGSAIEFYTEGGYTSGDEVKELVNEEANALQVRSPSDPHE